MDAFEELKRVITNEKSDDRAKEFYLSNISTLDKEKQQAILDLVIKMNNAGFKNNIPSAYSEVTENIPQFARMSVFKVMKMTVNFLTNLTIASMRVRLKSFYRFIQKLLYQSFILFLKRETQGRKKMI